MGEWYGSVCIHVFYMLKLGSVAHTHARDPEEAARRVYQGAVHRGKTKREACAKLNVATIVRMARSVPRAHHGAEGDVLQWSLWL